MLLIGKFSSVSINLIQPGIQYVPQTCLLPPLHLKFELLSFPSLRYHLLSLIDYQQAQNNSPGTGDLVLTLFLWLHTYKDDFNYFQAKHFYWVWRTQRNTIDMCCLHSFSSQNKLNVNDYIRNVWFLVMWQLNTVMFANQLFTMLPSNNEEFLKHLHCILITACRNGSE